MKITVENDISLVEEATAILLERMPVSKIARLLAVLQMGHGDYLKLRGQLFTGETVESLFSQAKPTP